MGYKRRYSSDECTPIPKRLKAKSELYSANQDPPPVTVTINGVTLEPTTVFDTFWRFSAERQAIHNKRRKRLPGPWTTDPILAGYGFCNVFRVLDRVSQYIVREVIEIGSQEPVEVIFRIVLFNTFTRTDTYELLRSKLGTPTWKKYSRKAYEKILRAAYDAGTKLYTGSFQKPAPNLGYREAFMNHLIFMEVLMRELPHQIEGVEYLADLFDWLCSFRSMGDFTAYQLLLNLSYSDVINFSDDDFVSIGLGARRGLHDCFDGVTREIEVGLVRWMKENQAEQFARLGLQFTGLGPGHKWMQLCDIEHTLCEVNKYVRLCKKHPNVKDFRPSGTLPKLSLPKAWSNPERQTTRIRAETRRDIVEKYIVSRVGTHRMVAGEREFFVYWEGYGDDEATWEPEDMLMMDAPFAVREYLENLKGRSYLSD